MASLSVIIITKNEEVNIRACLESVVWADEVIVVDSGSVDSTVDICREFGATIYVLDWPGFGVQKNRALSFASCDWVLSLDADERVTPELKQQLILAMQDETNSGYFIPRLSQFCGKFIKHCGWYPDYVLRLFKRTQGRFTDDLVHESILVNGNTAKLSKPLLHYSYLHESDVDRKTEQYSSAAAQQMFARRKSVTVLDAPLRGGWAFLRTYVLRLGFLDGAAGLSVSLMNARTTYLKYKKLETMYSA